MSVNPRLRFVSALFVCIALLAVSHAPAGQPPTLSAEGQNEQALHAYLFDKFLEGRKAVYQGNGRDRGLKELTILEEQKEIRDGDELMLPEGTERIAALFRHFGFHGENLDRIKEVHIFPFSPDKAPPRSIQVKEFYRVQMPSIPLADEPFESMKIRFLMKEADAVCRINDLVFYAQKAIPPEFDSIPYRDLGSEFPRQRVEVRIDVDHELSIGGTTDLQRDRWFRMHETPGTHHESLEKWAAERGFLPGRGAFKFNPALTRGWGKGETLKEREDQPGAADLTFFDRYDAGERLRRAIPLYREKPFACCFNDWPEFMSVPLVGRGTPRTEHFNDAAELAGAYVADQIKDAGYTAAWWEVKNESSVQSEWAHHWQEKDGIDGWGLLADFHNRVAESVHTRASDIKVGGPSSAYMQVQVQDFGLFRNQARFIEETRGHLDFFSHHFYENALMLGAHERRGMGYSNYLLGRYEAILDMLRAHMHKVDNVLPILITECGSLQNGRKPSDNWLRLYAWNAYLTKSMQRPDQIDLFVPFIFLQMSWNPYSGDAAFTPKADRKSHSTLGDFEPTTIAHYFDLWRDFDGHRLPVAYERDWLDVVAVHDGERVSLAVTNMGGRQIAIDLSGFADQAGATDASQTRLNYHQGQVVFEPEHPVDVAAIPVDVNETTVIRLRLRQRIDPSAILQQDRWYAVETAVASDGEPLEFQVDVERADTVESARLIIGVHRAGGVTQPLVVDLNDVPIVVDMGDASEFSEFFAPLDASVSTSMLRHRNRISIKAQPGTTITSVQLVTQRPQVSLHKTAP
ncbi:beta-agarase [Novipirellula artificiosorum]|nr:beta-agarase [Novipirellula artificiosorum]